MVLYPSSVRIRAACSAVSSAWLYAVSSSSSRPSFMLNTLLHRGQVWVVLAGFVGMVSPQVVHMLIR